MADHSPSLTRRTFVKTTGALGALAAAGGVLATSEGVVGETPVACGFTRNYCMEPM